MVIIPTTGPGKGGKFKFTIEDASFMAPLSFGFPSIRNHILKRGKNKPPPILTLCKSRDSGKIVVVA